MSLAREKECPCRGCLARTPSCHSTCKKYIEWNEEHKKIKTAIYEDKCSAFAADGFRIKQMLKRKNRYFRKENNR